MFSLVNHTNHADWCRDYFEFLAKECHEQLYFLLGYVATGSDQVTWRYFSHMEHDGVGAGLALMRMRGRTGAERARIGAPPDGAPLLKYALKKLAPPPPIEFKDVDWRRPGVLPNVIPWHAWSVERTKELMASMRKARLAPMGVLLWSLHRATARLLTKPGCVCQWSIPVNMHGADPRVSVDTSNQLSSVDVELPFDALPQAVNADLMQRFADGAHWAIWRLQALTSPPLMRLTRAMYARAYRTNEFRGQLGTFSWFGDYGDLSDIDIDFIIGAPPALKIAPVAAGAGIVGGRLCIAGHLHAVLDGQGDKAEALVDAWRNTLEHWEQA
ncbi:MAG: hypothetical protein OXU20_39580 [Myxococcales bacterium]|nr:hypothetical protein [Myxococcales bacterium]